MIRTSTETSFGQLADTLPDRMTFGQTTFDLPKTTKSPPPCLHRLHNFGNNLPIIELNEVIRHSVDKQVLDRRLPQRTALEHPELLHPPVLLAVALKWIETVILRLKGDYFNFFQSLDLSRPPFLIYFS